MSTQEISFLILVVGALLLFGGALGWASWIESRNTRRKI
jgi:hypothetical protein